MCIRDSNEDAAIRIAVLDFGVKKHILTSLAERGAFLKVFNAHTDFATLQSFKPVSYTHLDVYKRQIK